MFRGRAHVARPLLPGCMSAGRLSCRHVRHGFCFCARMGASVLGFTASKQRVKRHAEVQRCATVRSSIRKPEHARALPLMRAV